MRRIFKLLFIAIGVFALSMLSIYFIGWLLSFNLPKNLDLPGTVTLLPQKEIAVGDPVTGKVEFALPLCESVVGTELTLGEGAAIRGRVQIKRKAWRFTRQVWQVAFEFCAIKEGAIDSGVLKLEFSGTLQGEKSIEIPKFTATLKPLPPGTKPELAGEIVPAEKSRSLLWYALICVCFAFIALLWYYLHRRRGTKSLWDRTLEELTNLRLKLDAKDFLLEQGYVQLTDIVRDYMEERFKLPVASQTTPEFLAQFDREPSPLPAEERPILRVFLEAADRVKFAAFAPNDELLRQAIKCAVRLVESTRPIERKKENE
ncbi:MAG: hypothetical protein LBM70_05670 [Victivallales bacterium]|jgi:hypothetical protein|nr:hypothetical protein [Victivallales bacterium]